MARKKINLQDELLKRKTFSIPAVQKELGVGYKELRDSVSKMEKNGQATLSDDGLNFFVVDDSRSYANQSKNGNKTTSNQQRQSIRTVNQYGYDSEQTHDDEDDDEKDSADEIIARRRRELIERLAKLCEEDDDKDEEENEDLSGAPEDDCERLKRYASVANDCRLVDNVNYLDDMNNVKKIQDELGKSGYRLLLKTIQYGKSSTGYVFDCISQKKNIQDLTNFVDDVKSVINADKVTMVAPWSGVTVYILAQHNARFDSLCKKVLKYWIRRNGGRASIASVQRGLGIGFNRASKIMEHLQKFGCVEQPSSSDDVSKPLHVKLSMQEINILFPKFLGWD